MMKKIYMLLLIEIFLLISGEISKSQPPNFCPQGYTQIIVNIPIIDNGDTCMYEVILCVKCVLGTSPESIVEEIMVHAMRPLDTLCISDSAAVMNSIVQTINDPDWVYINIIPYCSNGWPPCNSNPPVPPIEVVYSYPICWQWDVFVINEDPYEEVRVKVASCDCFCKWTKFFCWEGQQLVELTGLAIPPDIDPESSCDCLQPEYSGECFVEPSPCSQ